MYYKMYTLALMFSVFSQSKEFIEHCNIAKTFLNIHFAYDQLSKVQLVNIRMNSYTHIYHISVTLFTKYLYFFILE